MRSLARNALDKALALVLGLFLLLALIRGGNTPFAMSLALGLSLCVAAVAGCLMYASRSNENRWSNAATSLNVALLLLMVGGALGLFTVAAAQWLTLPGRDAYAGVIDLLALPDLRVQRLALSTDPYATKRALLALVPCLVIAAAIPLLSRRALLQLLGAVAVFAVFEALIGLFQLGFRGASLLVLEYAGHNRASGTFVNKNHYATLLAMTLPLLIFRAAGQCSFFFHRGEPTAFSNVCWGAATAFVAAALVASLSRAGVLAGGIASLWAIGFCAVQRRTVSKRALLATAAILLLALSLATMTGLAQLIKSTTSGGVGEGLFGRTVMNQHTWSGIVEFFPLGAGLGSYAIAFQRFQTPGLLGFVEYAHNDYLQLLFELGALGVVVLALLLLAAVLAGRTLWLSRVAGDRLSPALACYLGASAFAIHAWFDFPSHIPAIAILATLLFAASMNLALVDVGRKRPAPAPITRLDTSQMPRASESSPLK